MARESILIVEDEGIIALHITDSLTKLGYRVAGTAVSGEESVSMAAEVRPDIVLMDIFLKGKMDGIEAADKIRRTLNIPVIFLTAHADEATLERAKVTEPFGYILKPFRERDLYITIEMGLYKHKLETERASLAKQLTEAIEHVKQLQGIIPICMTCKKIRDDEGYWKQLEVYITEHSEAMFSHGLCPECAIKVGEQYRQEMKKLRGET